MCKFINPFTKEKNYIMLSCDRSLIVFFIHSRCESWYLIANKSNDVIVWYNFEEFNFWWQIPSDIISTCCVKQKWKKNIFELPVT